MKIIQICPYDLSIPGGVQTHVTQLSNQLAENGHDLLILTPSIKNLAILKKVNCEIRHVCKSRRIGIWGTSIDVSIMDRKDRREVQGILDRFRPDVVHFHTIWNPFMPLQILRMLDRAPTKVATFHDTPPDFGIGKYVGGTLMRWGAGLALNRIDRGISVSESQAAAMGYQPGSYPDNLQVIPNGIDTRMYRTARSDRSGRDDFSILFIGRLERRKGVFDLLQVYRRLLSKLKEHKLRLDIVGDGPLRREVEDILSEQGVTGVTLHTDAGERKKLELLARSDLLAAPALYGESFGIVLLEAMASGVKVAGYGNAGYLNIGREYGIENFPEPGDRQGLFELIRDRIENPGKSGHLIERGYRIAERHDWRSVSKKIETVYNR